MNVAAISHAQPVSLRKRSREQRDPVQRLKKAPLNVQLIINAVLAKEYVFCASPALCLLLQ